jgi:hypothetical protein
MNKTPLLALSLVGLLACDKKDAVAPAAAKETPVAAAATKDAVAATPDKAVAPAAKPESKPEAAAVPTEEELEEEEAEEVPEWTTKEFVSESGALTKGIKLPIGGINLYTMTAPAGSKAGPYDLDAPSHQWQAFTSKGRQFSVRSAPVESDPATTCPYAADLRSKLKGATVVSDDAYHITRDDDATGRKPSMGDLVELLLWEKDGKAGFYVLKQFGWGGEDDDTLNICCTAGAPDRAGDYATLVALDDAKAMAAICLSIIGNY